MNDEEKTQIIVKLNILNGKLKALEQRILKQETSRLSFRLKRRWNKFFAVLYAMLTTAETGETFGIRLKMFLSTIWSWIKSGFKITEEHQQIARLEICRSCPQMTEHEQCKLCGCLMTSKVKIESASCPLGKW